jgi:hypothetical protein
MNRGTWATTSPIAASRAGQLWPYTLWCQVPPMNSSPNADLQVWAIMMRLTMLPVLPFIPGLRSIPRWSRVYRLIWRVHYQNLKSGALRKQAALGV